MLIWVLVGCYLAVGSAFGLYTWWDNVRNYGTKPNPLVRTIFWPVLVVAGLCLFLWDACSWAGGAFKPRR